MAAHCARVSAMPMLCLLDTHSATSACNIGESVVNMYCAVWQTLIKAQRGMQWMQCKLDIHVKGVKTKFWILKMFGGGTAASSGRGRGLHQRGHSVS